MYSPAGASFFEKRFDSPHFVLFKGCKLPCSGRYSLKGLRLKKAPLPLQVLGLFCSLQMCIALGGWEPKQPSIFVDYPKTSQL
jgi:hypothetical protein